MHNKTPSEICQWVEHLRCRSGVDIVRTIKSYHTDSPSIQGIWSPFTNKDPKLNVTEFPSLEYSKYQATELTASEKLLKIAEDLRKQDILGATEKAALDQSKS